MKKDNYIGFIGLGNLGSNLANSILISKYNLFVYDKNIQNTKKLILNGAILSKNIKCLLSKCSVIITCLPSPKEVSKVIEGKNGIINFINKNHLWIDMSTNDADEMKRLSKIIESKNANVLESPVTGGVHTSERGNISILVSGKKKVFKRAFPILSEIGYNILYCGKIGNSSILKVITNFLASINLLSLGEALTLSKKLGIYPVTTYKAIKISSGNSFVHETESKLILNGSYNVGFTMDLICKDLYLFDKLLKNSKMKSKINQIMIKTFNKGKKKYGSRSWSTKVIKLLEDKYKTNLRSKGFPSKLVDSRPRKKGIKV